MFYPYIERCAEVISELDSKSLAAMYCRDLLGSSHNNGYDVYSIGQTSSPEGLHLAIKVAEGRDVVSRLQTEVAAIDEMVRKAPSLAKKMPVFIGLLALDDIDNPVAILTEDATCGGELAIDPMPANPDTIEKLKQGFGDEADEAVQEIELQDSVAFNVGGEERWLDFTPSPVHPFASLSDPITQVKREVTNRKNDLTIVVPEVSPLGASIAATK